MQWWKEREDCMRGAACLLMRPRVHVVPGWSCSQTEAGDVYVAGERTGEWSGRRRFPGFAKDRIQVTASGEGVDARHMVSR